MVYSADVHFKTASVLLKRQWAEENDLTAQLNNPSNLNREQNKGALCEPCSAPYVSNRVWMVWALQQHACVHVSHQNNHTHKLKVIFI